MVLTREQLAIIGKYAHLVPYIARQTVKSWSTREELDEAIASGNLGLVKAAHNLDVSKASARATTHSQYIITTIKGTILHDMRARYGRSSIGGVARNKPGVMAGTADSLERPLDNDGLGEITLGDILAAGEDELEFTELRNTIIGVVRTFDKRSREVFLRRHELGQTQVEIADAVGCSQMQVSRLLTEMHRAIRLELAA